MLEFVSFQPLFWIGAIILLIALQRYSLVDRPRGRRWASLGLRAAAILFLILAICRPFAAEKNDRLHVNFLVDVSESVDLAAAEKSLEQIDQWISNLRGGDSWALFAVGRGVRQFESTAELKEVLTSWRNGVADDGFRSASQLGKSLLATRLVFPSDKVRRTVLLSDGQETEAGLEGVLAQLAEEGIETRFSRVSGLARAESAVVSLEPSSRDAFYGEVLRMNVELAANQKAAGELRLIHNGVIVQRQPVELSATGPTSASFDVDVKTPGATQWTAELVTENDHFPINNQASCTVTVRGRPRLLALHQEPQRLRAFTRIMQEQDIEVEVRGEHGLPDSLDELAAFDAIALADLPATSLTPRQMQMLKRFVTDLGGGLLMMGSENSFGLGGYYKTPVEEVLPLVSRYEKEKEKPSLAMVLVIDKSGSMQGTKIEMARQAAKATVELLGAQDSIAVIAFDSNTQVVCPLTTASDAATVQAAIDSLAASGGTNMAPAVAAAKETLEATPAKIRHVICLGDGRTPPANLEALAEEMADSGITLSTVAIGSADKALMSRLAELGRGRYYETDDPSNVPQIFTKETMQATKSAIKEDLFGSVQIGDHPILAGYTGSELPFTLGYVMTEPKPTAQLLLAVETGDPLMAVGRFGLGAGMAFTSDVTEKWGGEWLVWDGCGKFWAQAVRGLLRKNQVDGLQVVSHHAADQWRFDIRRVAPDGLPVNGIQWNAIALTPDGQEQPVAVRELGLGRYEASVSTAGRERITFRLHDASYDKTSVSHYHRPYPAEYRLNQELPAPLAKLSPVGSERLTDDLQPQRVRQPVGHYFYFAALACLVGSILLRRV
jgi:uncharacterized membrane protein/uncharacterized protein YegL